MEDKNHVALRLFIDGQVYSAKLYIDKDIKKNLNDVVNHLLLLVDKNKL